MLKLIVVVWTSNPSTQDAEAGWMGNPSYIAKSCLKTLGAEAGLRQSSVAECLPSFEGPGFDLQH